MQCPDRIQAALSPSRTNAETHPRIGRVRKSDTSDGAAALWNEVARATGLGEGGLSRIQTAGGRGLVVAIIDNLDTVLTGWNSPGEALNLRWALQNVDSLMVVAGAEGPIGAQGPHEHAVLAMTFATQSLQPRGQ